MSLSCELSWGGLGWAGLSLAKLGSVRGIVVICSIKHFPLSCVYVRFFSCDRQSVDKEILDVLPKIKEAKNIVGLMDRDTLTFDVALQRTEDEVLFAFLFFCRAHGAPFLYIFAAMICCTRVVTMVAGCLVFSVEYIYIYICICCVGVGRMLCSRPNASQNQNKPMYGMDRPICV